MKHALTAYSTRSVRLQYHVPRFRHSTLQRMEGIHTQTNSRIRVRSARTRTRLLVCVITRCTLWGIRTQMNTVH